MTKLTRDQRHGRRRWLGCLAAAGVAALLGATGPVQAASEQQELVDKATQTIKDFKAHPDMTWFRDHLPNAKAVVIVPVLLKAGFIFGGSGGHGMLLVRGKDGQGWSYPAFNFMGSVTFGLQIGGEAAQIVLMVMTDKGVNSMLSTELKLGADVSLAAGPIGAGAQVATTDVLAFSMDKGLFGGLTIEGAVIKPGGEWNQAYYGKPVDTVDIVIRHEASNPGANALRAALARFGGGGEQWRRLQCRDDPEGAGRQGLRSGPDRRPDGRQDPRGDQGLSERGRPGRHGRTDRGPPGKAAERAISGDVGAPHDVNDI